ncbi:MAG TPA: hypothetical protein VGK56_17635 [Anaerolineales bacterium]
MSENDSRYQAQNAGRIINDLIAHLRGDVNKVDGPQVIMLFDVSAEVPGSLLKEFHCDISQSEKECRVSEVEFELFAVKEGVPFPKGWLMSRPFGGDRGGWRQRKEW